MPNMTRDKKFSDNRGEMGRSLVTTVRMAIVQY